MQHYYLDAWIKTFVWFRFTIIIISDFSEREIFIWTLEYQTFLWRRNHVTYFHFGIPTCEKWRGRLLEGMCIFFCVHWNMNIHTIRLCLNRCSASHALFIVTRWNRNGIPCWRGGVFSTSTRLNDKLLRSKIILLHKTCTTEKLSRRIG